MFTSAADHKQDWKTNERRSCRREPLKWVVLVFFGKDNWGKLIDLSERGMRFQFSQPPSVREPINFTFEAMGCMPIPQEGKIFGDSFQAAGQVVWTREFERTAGVQFLDLPARSRDQIRYWISSVTAQAAVAPNKELNNELSPEWNGEWSSEPLDVPEEPCAPAEPRVSSAQARTEAPAGVSERDLENLDCDEESLWEPEPPVAPHRLGSLTSDAKWPPQTRPVSSPKRLEPLAFDREVQWEPDAAYAPQRLEPLASDTELLRETEPAFSQQRLAPLAFETPGILEHEERQRRGQTLGPKPRRQRARVGYVAALACLGAVCAVAAVIGIASRFTGGAESGEGVSHASQVDSGRTADRIVAGEKSSPFLVEVLDADSRRSVLWFSGDAQQSISDRSVPKPAFPGAPASSRKTTGEERPAVQANLEPLHDFSLVRPRAGGSGTDTSAASSTALVAPALGGEAPASLDVPLREALVSPAMPAPVESTLRQGGDVQPARLIRATLPVYPQLAKANRVAGDVTLDALIDASGNVRDLKVISGPVLLQAAAKDALRQWKYEPARLDGQPTAMHLTVTVKFRSSQNSQ